MKEFVSEFELEFKSNSEPHVERIVKSVVRPGFQKVRIRRIHSINKVKSIILVRTPDLLTIEDVEEIRYELHPRLLRRIQRIIRMYIKADIVRSATLTTSPTYRNLACIQVNRMWSETVDRKPGFVVCVKTKVKTVQGMKTALFAEAIAAVHINDVPAIGVEWSNLKLVTEQVNVTLCKVKQRTDGRVGLTIVVAQVTFVVATQRGNAEVRQKLPVV